MNTLAKALELRKECKDRYEKSLKESMRLCRLYVECVKVVDALLTPDGEVLE